MTARFRSYGLTIHPEKTRIVDFRHPWPSGDKPQTFDFLGFTHYWRKTRPGGYAVKRQTKSKKFHSALASIADWCKIHRHESVVQQHRKLSEKLRGHYAYYGIRGNFAALARFRHEAQTLWHYWLHRRSCERNGGARLWKLLSEHFPLPPARIVHGAINPQLAGPSDRSDYSLRRTGCVNCASPGLWGSQRATAGSTRKFPRSLGSQY